MTILYTKCTCKKPSVTDFGPDVTDITYGVGHCRKLDRIVVGWRGLVGGGSFVVLVGLNEVWSTDPWVPFDDGP